MHATYAADAKIWAYYDVPNLLHGRMAGTALSITITDLIRPIIGFRYSKTSVIDTFDDVWAEANAPEFTNRFPLRYEGRLHLQIKYRVEWFVQVVLANSKIVFD